MIKKIFSSLLVLCMLNFISLPALAQYASDKTNNIINAEFKTYLNVNKASKGQVVQFVSTQNCEIYGHIIPAGTIFSGEIKHFKKGRWGYRRAKAIIKIDKMILPDGETYEVNAGTKRHVLKGSALGNVGKEIVTFPVAIVTGAVGTVVIVAEAISIVGILLIGPTNYAVARTVGGLTHGVNCKKHEGDKIKLKVNSITRRDETRQEKTD